MKPVICCTLLCLFSIVSSAQQYLVYFKDKSHNLHSLTQPQTFLSERAIERRTRYGIGLDSTDLPVTASYLDSLRSISGVQILNASRWMNAVSVQVANSSILVQIHQLPFVVQSKKVGSRIAGRKRKFKTLPGANSVVKKHKTLSKADDVAPLQYGRSTAQIALHKGAFLHNIGLRGQNIAIGVLDAGFYHYDILPAFDSARNSGRISGTWDFVANEASVAEDDAHGMQCFSIIAANMPGTLIGTAPMSAYYLFRSEDAASERLIEEYNWVCAAEKLDSAGGDVISSSLGYDEFDNAADNHTYSSLNGNTTIVVQGADMAAKKGMLVVNAAGNSGEEPWRFIGTPADGDSVLAVGAVDARRLAAEFSSYGPSADGRIKPDVAALGVGTFVQATNGRITSGDGTSFATPVIAGLAACLWQGFQEANNMQIIEALRLSANKAQRPDEQTGYGIPDMQKATGILLKQQAQVEAEIKGCSVGLKWSSKDVASMKYVIERKAADENIFIKKAMQNGTGAAFGNRHYYWSDELFKEGKVDYRIMQILDTVKASYFALYLDTVSVAMPASCLLKNRFRIIPNPVAQQFVVEAAFEEAIEQLQLIVLNNNSQQVQVLKTSKPAGSAQFTIEANSLTAGKYYVQIYNQKVRIAVLEFLKL